jgi:hypothetical protein
VKFDATEPLGRNLASALRAGSLEGRTDFVEIDLRFPSIRIVSRGMSSPLHIFTTAADPVIAAGTNGMFYYGAIAFNRGSSLGTVFVARFMDLNNKENGNIAENSFPIRFINTVAVAYGNRRRPWWRMRASTAVMRPNAPPAKLVLIRQGTAPQCGIGRRQGLFDAGYFPFK